MGRGSSKLEGFEGVVNLVHKALPMLVLVGQVSCDSYCEALAGSCLVDPARDPVEDWDIEEGVF